MSFPLGTSPCETPTCRYHANREYRVYSTTAVSAEINHSRLPWGLVHVSRYCGAWVQLYNYESMSVTHQIGRRLAAFVLLKDVHDMVLSSLTLVARIALHSRRR